MIFRVEFRTDDPELIETLRDVRNKARFIKRALRHYISSKRGKETFRVMSKREIRDADSLKNKPAAQRSENSVPSVTEKGEKKTYDFDKFL
jgi:hypothetical protein